MLQKCNDLDTQHNDSSIIKINNVHEITRQTESTQAIL